MLSDETTLPVNSMNDTKFICMKWGDLYGPEYVNRLYSMVCVMRVVLLDLSVLRTTNLSYSNIECYPCPEIHIPYPHKIRGWRKVTLFQKEINYDLVVIGCI